MDSDDDIVDIVAIVAIAHTEPTQVVKKVRFHESLKQDVTHDRTFPRKIAIKRPRGDFEAYLQEREAERRYTFNECFRLIKERGDGPKVTLCVPPWKWSDNATTFGL